MNIELMTREDFEKVPHRKWNEEVRCKSLVLLPLRTKHSSGFRNIDLIAVDAKGEPICACSGCSDVIHFNGIGGYEIASKFYNDVVNAEFKIDCLGKSGLFRIFLNDYSADIIVDDALSDLGIYAKKEK